MTRSVWNSSAAGPSQNTTTASATAPTYASVSSLPWSNMTETPPLERKLVAILAADVVGYSRLMHDDEERTLATLTGHRAVIDD